MTRAGSVENAVEERQPNQAPDRAAIGLGGADQAGELPVEFRLLGENPAQHASHGRGRRRRTWRAERASLRECAVDHAGCEQKASDDRGQQRKMNDRSPAADDFHGHFTKILFAYSAPIVSEGSRWSAASWLS